MVPVLSAQITVVLPNVSTTLLRLMIIPSRISFQAPNAIKVVKATGISSGKMDIAKVSPTNKLSIISLDCQKLYAQTNKKTTMPMIAIHLTNFVI